MLMIWEAKHRVSWLQDAWKHFISAPVRLRRALLMASMNVNLWPLVLFFSHFPPQKNILIYLAQYNLASFFPLTLSLSLPAGVWQHLHLKNSCGLSTNAAYYRRERAHRRIYQFHLEGVVLAAAFVSKSELFEDKHGIIQSAPAPSLRHPLFAPPTSPPSLPPFTPPKPFPTSKRRGSDEGFGKKMENKLFICIWEESGHLSKNPTPSPTPLLPC